MRRRDFITLIGGAAAMWPMTARAQQSVKLPTVAFLGTGTSGSQGQWAAAFVKHLGELGWSDTRTARIDIRWAEGRADRVVELATEFSNAGVDVIVTTGTAVADTMRATQQIPIVFAVQLTP